MGGATPERLCVTASPFFPPFSHGGPGLRSMVPQSEIPVRAFPRIVCVCAPCLREIGRFLPQDIPFSVFRQIFFFFPAGLFLLKLWNTASHR